MVFSSIIFLFFFLPAVLLLYFAISAFSGFRLSRYKLKPENLLLLIGSLFFYTWGEQWIVGIIVLSTTVDYICGLVISGGWKSWHDPIEVLPKEQRRSALQKGALVASIVTNLSILGLFKYFNFGIDNFNRAAESLGLDAWVWHDVIQITLPLGISFYTFQSLSYTIDVYRGDTKATRNFLDFSCFVTLFPQLVAGPIVRYRDIASQLVNRVITREGFAEGVRRFIIGLGKKVLIANTVAAVADDIFAIPTHDLTTGVAWLGIVCYTLQIYFDFSGYSDMAIGLGRMFGFKYLENFQWPYIAQSIKEFWRRWHISLSTWFRDYLYIPLGGNKRSTGRTYLNLVVVFLLCGLWHGASWNFVVWGLFHGCFLVGERLGLGDGIGRCPRPLRHAYTLVVVMIGWVIFRADTLPQAGGMLLAMAGFSQGSGVIHHVDLYLTNEVLVFMSVGILFSVPWIPWLAAVRAKYISTRPGATVRLANGMIEVSVVIVLVLVLLACAMWLSSGTYNPFIYFRF